jgi:hypothetical protein
LYACRQRLRWKAVSRDMGARDLHMTLCNTQQGYSPPGRGNHLGAFPGGWQRVRPIQSQVSVGDGERFPLSASAESAEPMGRGPG